MSRPRPLVLMILDGWGYREETDHNAIAAADTPNWDRLWAEGSHTLIDTSGESVGLPAGQMGNSEVGHMNIGAGRIVYQDFTRITKAIETGEFQHNPVLCEAIDAARSNGATVHIMGLLSPGGVHSHEEHLFATVALARQRGASAIRVHAFLDGRDTPPQSAGPSIEKLEQLLDTIPNAAVGVICGRYFAMDRDKRWDRVEQAYQAINSADAPHAAPSATQALKSAYKEGETDEFVSPRVIGDYTGVKPGDSIIFVNFRADRARQISRAFVEPGFDSFERGDLPTLSHYVCMAEYSKDLPARVAFPPQTLSDIFGQVIADANLRQLRIAETEKYAHVTFFLNGGREQEFPGEDRILIPSPKVATYDLQPEMSAPELADALAEAIALERYDVIICNVANPDMVGHSGQLSAAIKAVEAVDRVLGRTRNALEAVGGELLVTSDHGNVEQMQDPETGQRHTAHTVNPVPLVHWGRESRLEQGGSLRDIAPTMLHLMGLQQPEAMTGRCLLTLSQGTRSAA